MSRVPGFLYRVLIILVLALGAYPQANAQPDNSDVQLWNDVTLSVPLNKKVDLFLAGTFWLGKNMSRRQEERAAIGLSFKPFKNFTFTPHLSIVQIRNIVGVWQPERRIILRAAYKLPIKKVGVTLRSNYEFRLRRNFNSWRFGAGVTFDKDIFKKQVSGLKAFVTEEFTYDSVPNRVSRNRLSGGINKKINKHLSVDLYLLRHDDNFVRPATIHALGAAWKITL